MAGDYRINHRENKDDRPNIEQRKVVARPAMRFHGRLISMVGCGDDRIASNCRPMRFVNSPHPTALLFSHKHQLNPDGYAPNKKTYTRHHRWVALGEPQRAT